MTTLDHALPCPFCGSEDLVIEPWANDDGEFDAIACRRCLGSAPADEWNQRHNPDRRGHRIDWNRLPALHKPETDGVRQARIDFEVTA